MNGPWQALHGLDEEPLQRHFARAFERDEARAAYVVAAAAFLRPLQRRLHHRQPFVHGAKITATTIGYHRSVQHMHAQERNEHNKTAPSYESYALSSDARMHPLRPTHHQRVDATGC